MTMLTTSRFVHNMITKRGQAQDIILKRLTDIMGSGRDSWDEQSLVKEVEHHFCLHNR
jgi:hypothetical protein